MGGEVTEATLAEDRLLALATRALHRGGMREDEAALAARVLVLADYSACAPTASAASRNISTACASAASMPAPR